MNIAVKRINRRALEVRICENGQTLDCRVNSESGVASVAGKYCALRVT
jgi:hypothetical protein